MMQTPVLLMIWRRPDTLYQLLSALRCVAPACIYVASDGALDDCPDQALKVSETRALIDREIDWPCQVEKLYSPVNYGCSKGPIRAISWFFDQVEEGIVLEDDCIPHPDFFSYCTELLGRYRYDSRVWCISGDNFQNGQRRGDASYYFSQYNHCWGWASWRRCWMHFDPAIRSWPALQASGLLSSMFNDPLEREYWTEIWSRTYREASSVTWWDYQWTFACMVNRGLTALPNVNLVSNIGFGADATHTNYQRSDLDAAASFVMTSTSKHSGFDGPIIHPSFVLRDELADRYEFDHKLNGLAMRRRRFLFIRFLTALRRRLVQARRFAFSAASL